MERRIAPPGSPDFINLLEKLTTVLPGSGRNESIFKSKQKVLMFAAALGVKLGQRLTLEKRGESIRYSIFQGAVDDTFINAIAIAETGDLKVLSAERMDERTTIFEEYAHAGLVELLKRLGMPGDDLEHVIQLVMDSRVQVEVPEGVIPDLAAMFSF